MPHEWANGSDYTQYNFPADSFYQYSPGNILNEHNNADGNARIQQAWLTAYILCRQAGLLAGFPRELEEWQNRKLILTPSPLTNTGGYQLYVPFWQHILPWVKAGGSLYASISAMSALSIPFVGQLFGVSLEDRLPWRPEITIEFTHAFAGIPKGEKFTFQAQPGLLYTGARLQVEGARVIAIDQDGNPAFVTFETGQGRTALCAYPIEMMLGVTPNALEEDTHYWKLYRALKTWAGVRSPYAITAPQVEVGLLSGSQRDYVVLVNHSASTKEGRVAVTGSALKVEQLTPDGRKSVSPQATGWEYHLEGFSGTVFEVIK